MCQTILRIILLFLPMATVAQHASSITLNIQADLFRTMGGEVIFYTKTKDGWYELRFEELVPESKYGGDGIRISDTKFLVIDSTELHRDEFEELAELRPIDKLNPMSDMALWEALKEGSFYKKEGEKWLHCFDVPGKYQGLQTHYGLVDKNEYKGYEPAQVADTKRRYAARTLTHDGLSWRFNKMNNYPLLLLRVNGKYPFLLIFDDDGYPDGYLLSTDNGFELGDGWCRGKECGWHFEKTKHRKYLDWADQEHWHLGDRFSIFREKNETQKDATSPLFGIRDTTTGVVLWPAFFKQCSFSNLHISIEDHQYNFSLLDNFLHPIAEEEPVMFRALNTGLEATDGVQVIFKNELYWISPIDGFTKKPTRIKIDFGICGTVSNWQDSIFKDDYAVNHIQFLHNSPDGSNHSDEYALDHEPTRRLYTDYYFLNGRKKQSYSENSGIGAIYDQIPFSTGIATRKDGLFDLIKLENLNHRLKTEVLLEGLEIVSSKHNYYPVLFKKNGLWGIFPAMQTGQYQTIGEFDYFFARASLPNGEWGWVDLNGRFFKDE